MRSCIGQPSSTPVHQQEGLVKRYYEIQYDFTVEFKKTAVTFERSFPVVFV
jgi:hypothetical protein